MVAAGRRSAPAGHRFAIRRGAYAQPGLLPDLGVSARFRAAVTVDDKTKWLDEFGSIDAVLSPGSARWTCRDDALGVTIALHVRPLVGPWGFAAEADVTASPARNVSLAWHVDKAQHAADKGNYAEYASAKYARLFLGTAEKNSRAEKGVLRVDLAAKPDTPRHSRLLCVWGYSDYNRQGVADAYKRLEFRPFDAAWLEGMKPKWFDHWIGGGLEPEKKFLDAREQFDALAKQADEFWARQRSRLRIKTPDARFDNVVNHVAAQARVQFEYPGFMHGLGYAKYGKINHGYYGFEAAGMHEEVADSLHLVAGTQDVTGRQRYNMTTFAISDWHEDMDFYFVEQCWYHWRWTGDERFLRAIWPAAHRALEHGLVVSDPDGDGLMSGYYEMWNCDGNTTGGHSALQTAMAWAALRAAATWPPGSTTATMPCVTAAAGGTIRSTPAVTRSSWNRRRSSTSHGSGTRTSAPGPRRRSAAGRVPGRTRASRTTRSGAGWARRCKTTWPCATSARITTTAI